MSDVEENGFRSAEDLFNEACRTQDDRTPFGFLSRNFIIITRDLQELADLRAQPALTAKEAAQILEWSYVIGAKHYTQFPDRADALIAKLRTVAKGADK